MSYENLPIDARVRPPYKEFVGMMNFDPGMKDSPTRHGVAAPPRSFVERNMDLFVEELDEAGIGRALVMGRHSAPQYGFIPNESLVEMRREYPDRFWVFGGVGEATVRQSIDEVNRCLDEHGFEGIAVDPGWSDPPLMPDAPELYPVYALCEQRQVPVSVTMSIFLGPNIDFAQPAAIQRVAVAFPDLTIIVVHGAWPWVTQMLGVAFRHRNVWLLPDFYMHIPRMPAAEQFVDAANYYLGDRLLYGSAYPARPVGQSLEEFRALDLNDDVLAKATGGNVRRLLEAK